MRVADNQVMAIVCVLDFTGRGRSGEITLASAQAAHGGHRPDLRKPPELLNEPSETEVLGRSTWNLGAFERQGLLWAPDRIKSSV